PNAGFSWTPTFKSGLLGRLFSSDQKSVIRGGYALTYYDEGTNMFASTAGNNPGQSQSLLLQPGMPGFVAGGLKLQSPLPPFQAQPVAYKEVWDQSETTFGTTGFGTMRRDLATPYLRGGTIAIMRLL